LQTANRNFLKNECKNQLDAGLMTEDQQTKKLNNILERILIFLRQCKSCWKTNID